MKAVILTVALLEAIVTGNGGVPEFGPARLHHFETTN